MYSAVCARESEVALATTAGPVEVWSLRGLPELLASLPAPAEQKGKGKGKVAALSWLSPGQLLGVAAADPADPAPPPPAVALWTLREGKTPKASRAFAFARVPLPAECAKAGREEAAGSSPTVCSLAREGAGGAAAGLLCLRGLAALVLATDPCAGPSDAPPEPAPAAALLAPPTGGIPSASW
jgi:hypothetical protein